MFAVLFDVLLVEIQDEIHQFALWEEGGDLEGHQNSEQIVFEQIGVS